jgi:hypothetical protein
LNKRQAAVGKSFIWNDPAIKERLCVSSTAPLMRRTPRKSIARIDRTALITLIYGILRGRYRSQLPTAGGSRSTATSNTDRGSKACESDVLQVFLLPQPPRGRCGRWFSRALLMACDLCRWIAPMRNVPIRSLARRTPPLPYQLCRQGRSASSTQAILCRLP